jgi:hypothetical protein
LFSEDDISINGGDSHSLSELEYDIAVNLKIPCLIYFKEDQENTNISNLRNKVLKNHTIRIFETSDQLQRNLVIDLIKIFREKLFDKLEINQQGRFSLESLHLLCQSTISEQIKLVGREKFIPDIYIERDVEEEIEQFADFENFFIEKSNDLINDLAQIAQEYSLPDRVYKSLVSTKSIVKNFQSLDEYCQFTDELKKYFYFDEIETIFGLVNRTVRLPKEKESSFRSNLKTIDSYLHNLPFVPQKSLQYIPQQLYRLRESFLEKVDNFPRKVEDFLLSNFLHGKYNYIDGVPSKRKFTNDLIRELNNLIQLKFQKCIALVSNAGYGKTNVICHLACKLSKKYPVVLLSGQMEVSSEQDIVFHVKRQLESLLPISLSNWVSRVKTVANDQYLFVLIDGINESSNLPLLIRFLKDFIFKIENVKIKIVVTCRNIFWDLFSATLQNSLFNGKILNLNEFTEQEKRRAIQLYFSRYNIHSNFDFGSTLSLSNPILLRFFCEANRDRQIERVSSIELLSVFDLYLERISERINEQFGFLGSDSIVHFLVKIGNKMWRNRRTSLNLDELEITSEEASNKSSIFNLLRSENIVFAENFQSYTNRKDLRFLYDEFMEYVIARSWLYFIERSQDSEKATESLMQEITSTLSSFSSALGATIFLDKMIKGNGKLVSRIVTLLSQSEDEFVASRQIIMLSAFENIATDSISDEMMFAIDKFERIAKDEIRGKLAPIMIQVFRQRPDHPVTHQILSRMLEVRHIEKVITEKKDLDCNLSDISTKQVEAQIGATSSIGVQTIDEELAALRKALDLQNVTLNRQNEPAKTSEVPKKSSTDKKDRLISQLPPGRYHYNEEVKLSAISILVASQNNSAILEEGINNLGKMDLHSALTALTSLDLADDELVYKMLSKYYNAYLPEYRIYCAWLLRNRYGLRPSEYLTGLLMDRESRVHRYTIGLFKERHIEKELLLSLLSIANSNSQIKSWHLINVIKLLGRRDIFYPQDLIQFYNSQIVSTLMNLCSHEKDSLRLEAYRAIIKYDEFINRQSIINSMEKDRDNYIRREAANIKLS